MQHKISRNICLTGTLKMRPSPRAVYTSPSHPEPIEFTPGDGPHSTQGKTTQISDVVIRAGGQDRDRPTHALDTYLGSLRTELTTLQDKINEFLTERMAEAKMHGTDSTDEIERKLLDEGHDEDSD